MVAFTEPRLCARPGTGLRCYLCCCTSSSKVDPSPTAHHPPATWAAFLLFRQISLTSGPLHSLLLLSAVLFPPRLSQLGPSHSPGLGSNGICSLEWKHPHPSLTLRSPATSLFFITFRMLVKFTHCFCFPTSSLARDILFYQTSRQIAQLILFYTRLTPF